MRVRVPCHRFAIAFAITLVVVLFQVRATVGLVRGSRRVVVSKGRTAPSSVALPPSKQLRTFQHRRSLGTGANEGEPDEDDPLKWERMYYESEKPYVPRLHFLRHSAATRFLTIEAPTDRLPAS
jgi:hypothetical protein